MIFNLYFCWAMSLRITKGKKEHCKALLELIQELADFEKAPNEVSVSLTQLEEDGFGINPIYEFFVALEDEVVIGIALFYEKYSTWKGRSLYLEDLIVTEKKRGIGAGKLLFENVMQEAKRRNSGRMEWQVLDWNETAIQFYKKYQAVLDGEWLNAQFRSEQLQSIKCDESI